ncbi:MAG: hypothetical protein M3Y31_10210 [Gemmatimonadota bacterium]|nr:hypothetical protein [Gemmatimonadota bacterium]
MNRRLLIIVPLLGAAAAGSSSDTLQYDVAIRGQALGVTLSQGPDGARAEAQTRPRSATARLSVTTTDSASGRAVMMRVDTLDVPAPPAPPNAQVRRDDDATGATWQGFVPSGTEPLRLSATGPAGQRMLDETVLLLFPQIPGNLEPGASWSDTAHFEIGAEDARSTGHAISDYRVTGGDASTGYRVERAFHGDRTNRLKSQQGEVLVQSKARGTVSYALDAAGSIVSANIVRSLESDMHLPGIEAPVKGVTSDTITVTRR